MLSSGFARPLRLRRKTSRLLAVYLASLHLLGLLALLQPLAVVTVIHGLLYLLWAGSAVFHTMYFYRQRDVAGDFWVWQGGGDWLRTGQHQLYSLDAGQSLQTPWFVIVTLVAPELPRQRLLCLCDQLDSDSFRRLRVRLKLYHDDAVARHEEAL